jgi:hypothetical protein
MACALSGGSLKQREGHEDEEEFAEQRMGRKGARSTAHCQRVAILVDGVVARLQADGRAAPSTGWHVMRHFEIQLHLFCPDVMSRL